MKQIIQSTEETMKGCRVFTPNLVATQKARLNVLQVEMTKHLLIEDIRDCRNENMRHHLIEALAQLNQAVAYGEK